MGETKILNRLNGKVIYSGNGSIREVLIDAVANGIDLTEANLRKANLRKADLRKADLRKADLREANLRKAYLWGAYLWGAYLWEADLREANLRKANLEGADLREAYLWEADLWEADLREADLRKANLRGACLWEADLAGADLKDISGYVDSHDIFIELCRRQEVDVFTKNEWSIIDTIAIHRICWNEIQERFGSEVMPIFEKLAEAGWVEYRDHYAKLLADKEKR